MGLLPEDLDDITNDLGELSRLFKNKRVVLAGSLGFLGYGFLHFLAHLNEKFGLNICVDALDIRSPDTVSWAKKLQSAADNGITFYEFDIADKQQFENLGRFDYFIHAASIASPSFYRQFPIQTIKANIFGLFNLLEFSVKQAPSAGILFFSSSEVYGDPDAAFVPTAEDYVGRVSFTGPRACYDESKRLGETICVNFHQEHDLNIKIARPFNNYGPGLLLGDKRLVPDICKSILANENIELFSDGSPTRTFCYISDAIKGYLRTLLIGNSGTAYNIGNDKPEITVTQMAEFFAEEANLITGYSKDIISSQSQDRAYLTDNPQRRCPDLKRARAELGFEPRIDVKSGARRTLRWYLEHQD